MRTTTGTPTEAFEHDQEKGIETNPPTHTRCCTHEKSPFTSSLNHLCHNPASSAGGGGTQVAISGVIRCRFAPPPHQRASARRPPSLVLSSSPVLSRLHHHHRLTFPFSICVPYSAVAALSRMSFFASTEDFRNPQSQWFLRGVADGRPRWLLATALSLNACEKKGGHQSQPARRALS